jgi:hypothetical protein
MMTHGRIMGYGRLHVSITTERNSQDTEKMAARQE